MGTARMSRAERLAVLRLGSIRCSRAGMKATEFHRQAIRDALEVAKERSKTGETLTDGAVLAIDTRDSPGAKTAADALKLCGLSADEARARIAQHNTEAEKRGVPGVSIGWFYPDRLFALMVNAGVPHNEAQTWLTEPPKQGCFRLVMLSNWKLNLVYVPIPKNADN